MPVLADGDRAVRLEVPAAQPRPVGRAAVERAGAQPGRRHAALGGRPHEVGEQPYGLLGLRGAAGLQRGGVPRNGLLALLVPGGTLVVGVHGDDPNGTRTHSATRV
nr:hypothetical protein GCM10020092_027180 [Actinoplanes digitatis]